MIKILHFVSVMDRGGQETFIMNLYRRIDRAKYQFLFLCTSSAKGDYDDEIIELGGKIYHIDERKTSHRLNRLRNYIEFSDSISAWLSCHRDCFDIVHLHTSHALDVWVHLRAFKKANVKSICVHSHNTNAPHKIVHRFFKRLNSVFYDFEKIACSEAAAEWMFTKKDIRRHEVSIVYNGININDFLNQDYQADTLREELGIKGKTVLGHIGRFSQQKNHKFLIDVFYEYKKINDNSVLVLVGRGELEKTIKSYCDELGLSDSVLFLGVRNDVPRLLHMFDYFLFPSFYEGLSVVLIEAQVSGARIFTNRNIAPETIIGDGIQLLDITDPKEWAIRISRTPIVKSHPSSEKIQLFDSKFSSVKVTNIYERLCLNGVIKE